MDYYLLTDLAATMGYHLAMSGAETFRVEDTIHRILRAYGVECEVFAIPNCVSVSLEAANGKPLMVMRRIGFHGNDLEKLEKLNELSRHICEEQPEVDEAMAWLHQTLAACRTYRTGVFYLGNVLVGLGFSLVFGGTLRDCLWAGVMGLIIGLVTRFMDRQEANPFFSTILASCLMALPAYAAAGLGWLNNPDAAIIGALMILVPGLLITNSMRDIIYGDTNSGIFRIVQVVLSALAIAVFVGCCGFCILFNVHGQGMVLCIAGGVAAWMLYLLCGWLGCDVYAANLFAAVFAALYAEVMARVRKCPAMPYLVIATLPMLPGAGVYYTMSMGLEGNMMDAVGKGLETVGVAGSLARCSVSSTAGGCDRTGSIQRESRRFRSTSAAALTTDSSDTFFHGRYRFTPPLVTHVTNNACYHSPGSLPVKTQQTLRHSRRGLALRFGAKRAQPEGLLLLL